MRTNRRPHLLQVACYAVVFILFFAAFACGDETIFHVAPNGSDANAGTKSKPFATLAKARDVARAHNPARVVVHGGRYFLGAPLDLTAADSGLVIEAAQRETPVLVGGRRITGWQRDGEHCWAAAVPEAAGGKWDFRMLVVNGAFCPRARLPETGTFTHLTEFKVPWMATSGGGWKRKPTVEELTTMRYRPGDLGAWLDTASAEVTVFHMWDETRVGLAAHDPATQTLTFSTPSGHPPGAFGVKKFVVWNVREGLRAPGQWCLDKRVGRVVYWPQRGEDMRRADVLAPTMESLIRFNGTPKAPVRDVMLKGLTLTVTTTPLKAGGFGAGVFGGAVHAIHANDCRFQNLTIFNVAGQGIRTWNCQQLYVEGCHVRDTGACGIRLSGDECVVANNHVHRVGRLYPSAIAVSIGGQRNRIADNEIHDTPYSALTAGSNGHLIERNLIYRAMQELHDGAGIYITFCTNVVVRGNVVRDITDLGGYGASAYYLDEQARDCLVESNLSVNVAWPVHLHMTTNNVVRGNVFITPGNAKVSMARTTGAVFERNVFHAGGEILFRCATNGIAAMPNNIFYSKTGQVIWERLSDYNVKAKLPLELRDGSIGADPRFVRIERGDYRFQSGSPAPALGIEPLKLPQANRKLRPE
ncbi:MAG: right-handed parallel beta-helix repeat-containing protein [Verrucomicrobiia bacterium]